MPGHVFVRVSGHGWTLLPVAPYRLVQLDSGLPAVRATHHHPDGDRTVSVRVDGPDLRWSADTPGARLEDVLDVTHGPDLGRWVIETTVFTCDWPGGFALQSTADPFDLVGPDGGLIWVRTSPAGRAVSPEELVAPGQTVLAVDRGRGWAAVEIGYDQDGREWRQVHRILDVGGDRRRLIVTSQTPSNGAEVVRTAGDQVFDSLRPFRGDGPTYG